MKRRKHPAGTRARYVVRLEGEDQYLAHSRTAPLFWCGVAPLPGHSIEELEAESPDTQTIFQVYDADVAKAASKRGWKGRWVPVTRP